jgi:hypothetical protein
VAWWLAGAEVDGAERPAVSDEPDEQAAAAARTPATRTIGPTRKRTMPLPADCAQFIGRFELESGVSPRSQHAGDSRSW